MPSRPEDTAWDFSQVLDLVNTLTYRSPAFGEDEALARQKENTPVRQAPVEEEAFSGLGDFSKLWNYLGVSNSSPSPVIPINTQPALEPFSEREAYTSDGATYRPPTSKGVKWRDEVSSTEIADASVDDASPEDASQEDASQEDTPQDATPATALTKTQRKKQRRRERARLEQAEKVRAASDYELESELRHAQRTPAGKAGVHTITVEAEPTRTHRYNLRPRTAPSTPVRGISEQKRPGVSATCKLQQDSVVAENLSSSREPSSTAKADGPTRAVGKKNESVPPSKSGGNAVREDMQETTIHTPRKGPQKPLASAQSSKPGAPKSPTMPRSEPRPTLSSHKSVPLSVAGRPLQPVSHALQQSLRMQWQTQLPAFVPCVVNPGVCSNLPSPFIQQNTLPATPSRKQSKPLVVRNKDDRYWNFRLKLIHNFGEDKSWLVKAVQHADHTNAPDGIHVFVDFSNIWIGFMEYLRRVKGFQSNLKIPVTSMDFESLVLLLERGRPVAKRVLAGSAPLLPAFDLAKRIGYETNILDKVYKAKELTERQKRFLTQAHHHRRRASNSAGGDASSGSETTAALAAFAPEKWVEQGVDEILHLKILESVVDVEMPTTIVLATGDAAEAEYSQGFMRMVERALKKGWKVELVAWNKGISFAYRKKQFVQAWCERFRVIELDDYAEDLLDT